MERLLVHQGWHFGNITKADFLGTPEIVPDVNFVVLPFDVDAPLETFHSNYLARIGRDKAIAFDGERFVALFSRGDGRRCSVVFTKPAYRGQHIAHELVYQTIIRTGLTTPAKRRTVSGQAVYESVWRRIQQENFNAGYRR